MKIVRHRSDRRRKEADRKRRAEEAS